MRIQLTKIQEDAVSKYFADISKLIFAAMVIGFFVPISSEPVTTPVFVGGIVTTVTTIWYSISLVK